MPNRNSDVPCAKKFLQEFFFGRLAFFCVLGELIFAIRADWFFLLGINFCDFQKVPITQHRQYFRFYFVRAIEIYIFKQTSISLYTVVFLYERDKL